MPPNKEIARRWLWLILRLGIILLVVLEINLQVANWLSYGLISLSLVGHFVVHSHWLFMDNDQTKVRHEDVAWLNLIVITGYPFVAGYVLYERYSLRLETLVLVLGAIVYSVFSYACAQIMTSPERNDP